MALENEGMGTTMLVSPTNGGGFGNAFGGDGLWILILFILLAGGNGFGGGMGGNNLYPWLNNSENINGGFRDQFLNTNVTSIRDGIGNLSTQLCNGFSQAEIAANGRQMADMNQTFALQSAMQNCCCENRLATAQTQNIVQSEAAATRLAIQEQTQAILDKMCQQEIDNLKAQNLALQNQVNMQNLRASQVSQTAQLIADNTAQTQYIVNRIAPYPVPAYTVTNPNTPSA